MNYRWYNCKLFLLLSLSLAGCETLEQAANLGGLTEPSSVNVSKGLKEALDVGIQRGAQSLSENGYLGTPYQIDLPPEAKVVVDKLGFLPGMANVGSALQTKLNEAAREAADQAIPIFENAIQDMSFTDARKILLSDNSEAATDYLEATTYQQLYQTYHPTIASSLNQVGAQSFWGELVNRYNQLPLVEPANADLADFVTEQALNGLFSKLAVEERAIREDPAQRVSSLMKQVFALQD